MTDDDNTQQRSAAKPARRKGLGCGGCFWPGVGMGLFLLVIIVFLLPPNVPHRGLEQRIRCTNNLRNIGLALHNYQCRYGVFPPAYTVDKRGRRMHSWRALLLEFLDPDLYAKYDFDQPWNSPGNLKVAGMMKKDGPYYCPSEEPKDSLTTSYVMLVGPTAFSAGPSGRKPKEITDGEANTMAVVEMSPSGILWTAPYDLEVSEMSFEVNAPAHPGVRSCHADCANVLFVDGHTQTLAGRSIEADFEERLTANAEHLKALTTINGGEKIDDSIGY